MIGLIDADILAYQACFSGKNDYLKTVESIEFYIDKIVGRYNNCLN